MIKDDGMKEESIFDLIEGSGFNVIMHTKPHQKISDPLQEFATACTD